MERREGASIEGERLLAHSKSRDRLLVWKIFLEWIIIGGRRGGELTCKWHASGGNRGEDAGFPLVVSRRLVRLIQVERGRVDLALAALFPRDKLREQVNFDPHDPLNQNVSPDEAWVLRACNKRDKR